MKHENLYPADSYMNEAANEAVRKIQRDKAHQLERTQRLINETDNPLRVVRLLLVSEKSTASATSAKLAHVIRYLLDTYPELKEPLFDYKEEETRG